jgi:hypothetical protein
MPGKQVFAHSLLLLEVNEHNICRIGINQKIKISKNQLKTILELKCRICIMMMKASFKELNASGL